MENGNEMKGKDPIENINMDALLETSRAVTIRLDELMVNVVRLKSKLYGEEPESMKANDDKNKIPRRPPIHAIHHNMVESHDVISNLNEVIGNLHAIIGLD
jgi:hypothetical protein